MRRFRFAFQPGTECQPEGISSELFALRRRAWYQPPISPGRFSRMASLSVFSSESAEGKGASFSLFFALSMHRPI